MTAPDADELIPFQDVRILNTTASALLCGSGRSVSGFPVHASGKLWCTGDRGKLFVRRWVARDRGLIDTLEPVAPSDGEPAGAPKPTRDILHAVRTGPRAGNGGPPDAGVDAPRGRRVRGLSSAPAPDKRLAAVVGEEGARPAVASLVERRLRTGLVIPPDGSACPA